MADIKVCDRCGKRLPDITSRFGFTIKHEWSISVLCCSQTYYDYSPNKYNLCEDCYCDFIDFLYDRNH